jgi:hypothetical protein
LIQVPPGDLAVEVHARATTHPGFMHQSSVALSALTIERCCRMAQRALYQVPREFWGAGTLQRFESLYARVQ